MGERPKVVVDVQFQGPETEHGIVQEQFEFQLVGSRIHVRPCAPDHPQGAAYASPRKRPASPPNELIKSKSSSPTLSRGNIVEQKIIRYRDRSTSPCFTRKIPYEDSFERFPPRERRPKRRIMKHEDSNTSVSSYPEAGTQLRKNRKENAMWNIVTRESDDNSIGPSASIEDINCGTLQYCVREANDGNYSFTARRSKNADRKKRGRKNLAVQAGYDEDLRFKRLKQFSEGRNKDELSQRTNKVMVRDMAEPKYIRHKPDMNNAESKRERRPYKKIEKNQCLFSCHPPYPDETSPIVCEEFEMYTSTETIRREPNKDDEQDEEDDVKKPAGSKKPHKNKRKSVKREPPSNEPNKEGELEAEESENEELKPARKDRDKQTHRQKSKILKTSNEPEEEEELEAEESENEELKPKRKDRNKQINRQKSKSIKMEKISVDEEDPNDDIQESKTKDTTLKSINLQVKSENSAENTRKKEEKNEERQTSAQSKNRLSPESAKKKEEIKEEKETYMKMTRNCCRKASLTQQGYYDKKDK